MTKKGQLGRFSWEYSYDNWLTLKMDDTILVDGFVQNPQQTIINAIKNN